MSEDEIKLYLLDILEDLNEKKISMQYSAERCEDFASDGVTVSA